MRAAVVLALMLAGCQSASELRSVRVISASGSSAQLVLLVETEVENGPILGSSPCSSIFDGTTVRLTDPSGRRVFEQPHAYTCSPYRDAQPVQLDDGISRTTLTFALPEGAPWEHTTAELDGTLAGRPDIVVRSNGAPVSGP